jgi:hypothetical protein
MAKKGPDASRGSSSAASSVALPVVLTFCVAFLLGMVVGPVMYGASDAKQLTPDLPLSFATDSLEILRNPANFTRFPCKSSDRLAWEPYCEKIGCHKDKYLKQIHSDLAIWRGGGIQKGMMEYTMHQFHITFQIIDNELYVITKPNDDYLVDQWITFLSDMLEHVTMPDVEFSINTRDRPKAPNHETTPVFSHVKTDAHSDILVIHPWQYDLFREGGYHQKQLNVDFALAKENVRAAKAGSSALKSQHKKSWEQRASKAVWRGSPNGGDMRLSNYRQHPRPRVADIGLAHPDLIDAKVRRASNYPSSCPPHVSLVVCVSLVH